MVFLELQGINLQGNMQGINCDEYCMFLSEILKKFLSPSVAFFSKYFYLNSPWCFQMILISQ